MNFDAERFIRETERKIREFRSRATWLKVAANISAAVAVIIVITALLQAMLRALYAFGAHRQAQTIWTFFVQNVRLLWLFVLALPFPKTMPHGNGDFLPWGMTLAFYACIILVCAVLKNRGITLRKIADKAEETLNLQAPLLMQMSAFAAAAGQSAKVGNISGNGNTVNATNSVTHILHEGENQNLLWKILIPIGGAVAAAIVNHFLHLT